MHTYSLSRGWEISFPESWTSEVDELGTYLFYPENDPTTVYASVLHAEGQGKPAPSAVMLKAFMQSLPENAEEISLTVKDLNCKAFFCDDSSGLFRISAGFFTDGELLTLNVYSETKAAVRDTLEYFKSVERR